MMPACRQSPGRMDSVMNIQTDRFRPTVGWTAILVLLLGVTGCADPPAQTESMDYRARAETRVEGAVRVSAVALSPAESAASGASALRRRCRTIPASVPPKSSLNHL